MSASWVQRIKGLIPKSRSEPVVAGPPPERACTVCDAPSIGIGESRLTQDKIARPGYASSWLRVAEARYRYTSQRIFCCTGCGLIFIDPVLDDWTTLKLIFEACQLHPPTVSTDWQPVSFRGDPSLFSTAVRIPSLNNVLAKYLDRPVRVLDIGAHGGEVSLGLRLPEGSLVDLLQCENPFARCPPRAGVRQFQGLLEHLAPAEYRADVLLALHVLEHCQDPRRFLQNAAGLMEPDGILVIEVPYEMPSAFEVAFGNLFELPHHSFFTPWSLKALIDRSPLKLLEIELLDNFHTGHGDCAYPVIRAIAGRRDQRPDAPAGENSQPYWNLARTIDKFFSNLSGSLAYLGGVQFVVFVHKPQQRSLANLLARAPGFQGIVSSNPALPDTNIFDRDMLGIDLVITLNAADREALRASLKPGVSVH